jgi:hypothetical protein
MPGPARERPENPIFYSELMRVVERLGLEKASGAQWLGTLNNLRGVKKEEMRWVGLPEWLAEQQGEVTKAEVLDFLSAQEVRVEDVVKGGESFAEVVREVAFDRGYWAQIEKEDDPDCGKWVVMFRDAERGVFATEHEAREALIREAGDFLSDSWWRRDEYMNFDTAYSKFQLPGGDRYRELLLTWPMMAGDEAEAGGIYHSPHFDEANVLVHIRFNERTDTSGQRLLFLEEVQSDWHQQGRRRGYREGKPKPVTYQDYAAHQGIAEEEARQIESRDDPSDPQWAEMALWMVEESCERQLSWSEKVTNSPFKISWPELALKRMLRWGAEHGFDRIAWTTGEQQARRYDDEAGEGVYRFYDKVLPAVANKYGKRWGVKAGKTSIDTGPSPYELRYENGFWQVYEGDHSIGRPIGTREDGQEFLYWLEREEARGGVIEVHALDITPGLRDSVLQGQPLFLAFGSGAPGKAGPESTARGVVQPPEADALVGVQPRARGALPQGGNQERTEGGHHGMEKSMPGLSQEELQLIRVANEMHKVLRAIVATADNNPHAPIGHVVEHGGGKEARAILDKWDSASLDVAHRYRLEQHLAEGPTDTTSEIRLHNAIEDQKGYGDWDTAKRMELELWALSAQLGPAKWRDHIETCREEGFPHLAEKFEAQLKELMPRWQRILKEASAELRDMDAVESLHLGLEDWRHLEKEEQNRHAAERESFQSKGEPVTREQINREMQEADKIRENMLARVAERVEKKVGALREGTAAEIYGKIQDVVSGPLADIRRRVVEEPTYGKTVFDVVYDRQHSGSIWGRDNHPAGNNPVDQEPAVQGSERSQAEKDMADIMQRFYGPKQNPGEDRGRDNGMEP